MYSLMDLPNSIVILLLWNLKWFTWIQGRKSYKRWQESVTVSCGFSTEYNKHTGNTTEISRVAAEAVELSIGMERGSSLFLLQFLFVLSYSGLSLLSLQSLQGPNTETDLGTLWLYFPVQPSTEDSSICWGTFLFGTQSTLSLFEDQVPNFSHCGKTLSWSSLFTCSQE